MPTFDALYYPNFEPPYQWLRSFLLFFDRIQSIVPNDVNFEPSINVRKILDTFPDAFNTISPKTEDIALNTLNLDRMRKAFQLIKGQSLAGESKKIEVCIENGAIRIPDHVFLHDRKIADNVRSLLEEFKLVKSDFGRFAELMGADNFSIVNERASNLILSLVADNIGKRYGINTVTDSSVDFTVNALNAMGSSLLEPTTLLASSIINLEIPEDIGRIEISKYKEIRDAYSDIRQPFHRLLVDLTNLYRLDHIGDMQVLREKVSEIAKELTSELNKFRKSKFGRSLRRWMPIGIGGLASLAGAAFSEPSISYTAAGVTVVVQIIQETHFFKQESSNQEEVHRMIARMKKDILTAAQVKSLV
ncbi:MAG: hypothetical protein ACLP3B_08505 [Syntrophobacteraceae bacterium]